MDTGLRDSQGSGTWGMILATAVLGGTVGVGVGVAVLGWKVVVAFALIFSILLLSWGHVWLIKRIYHAWRRVNQKEQPDSWPS